MLGIFCKKEDEMNVKVKKLHNDAVIPMRAKDTDAGYDLVAIDDGEIVYSGDKNIDNHILYIQFRTGLAIEPEPGYHTEIVPRSSITKHHYVLGNSIGIVDEGYRGELLVRFKPTMSVDNMFFQKYKKGDRIAQLVIRKTETANFEWADELKDSSRGEGGFGSSGS